MRIRPLLVGMIVAALAAIVSGVAVAGPVGKPDTSADGNAQAIGARITPKKLFKKRFMPTALEVTTALKSTTAADGVPVPTTKVRIDFDTHIRPILQDQCLKCHARGKYKGGLSLETREAIMRGGEGGPAAVAGKSGESLLIELVAGIDPVRQMPDKAEPLSNEQIGLLRAWIDQGLPWPEGLSFGFRRAPLAPDRTPARP